MTAGKKFNRSSDEFFKFTDEGDELVGEWRGSRPGRYESRIGSVETEDGREVAFSLSKALEDLDLIPTGTRVKIAFTGWDESKSGTRFKSFDIFTAGEVAPVAPPAEKRAAQAVKTDCAERFEATDEDVPF